MPKGSFFEESQEQSVVKAEIVEKYFDAWAQIVVATQKRYPYQAQRIAYVDLFAGPGRYKDGSISTPLRVLQKAINNPKYGERLVAVFNDKDEESIRTLQNAVESLPGIERLRYKPTIRHEEVGSEIAKIFAAFRKVPTLAFIDPWGYKGLSLDLVDAFLKDWGCDCIFFFNYNRINAGLSNPVVKNHMAALFGVGRAEALGARLASMPPEVREATIVEELASALKEHGHPFVLPFCFKRASGNRTSHHLFLVTKSFRGYDVMKDIMARCSSENTQGVPSFSYLPPTATEQRVLFELSRPIEELGTLLLSEFAGRSISVRDLYECHSVDRPFIARNYKVALSELLEQGRIQTSRRPRAGTFADDIVVRFPPR